MQRIVTSIIAAALAASLFVVPVTASAGVSVGVGVSVNIGPPPLPYYPQPVSPGPGYLWTPGYWAYGDYGYYWVPGTWAMAPAVGLLWTPGYWGWNTGVYLWHPGYWGPHVGFYGGVNYGYGYGGVGFAGGAWHGNVFIADRIVMHDDNVVRVSFNGGVGGISLHATAEQEAFAREHHFAATSEQMHHERMAMANPAQRFAQNHGRPDIAATARPGRFNEPGVVRMNARGDAYAFHPAAHNEGSHNPGMHGPGPAAHAPRPHGQERGPAPHEDRRPPHRR